MKVEEKYKKRYKLKDTPWDIGKPDFNLIETVNETPVQKCRALEIGCGTGDNSIWLAQNGFTATGTDISDEALAIAKDKAAKANAACVFMNVNFFTRNVEGAPFDFVFDRGCFHSFGSEEDRSRFALNVALNLEKSGLWLTLLGNADEKRDRPDPPQRSARDIILATEPYFEVLSLTTTHFGSDSPTPPRAWRCLLRRRRFIDA